MMGEEQVVHLGWKQPSLDQLMGRRRTAIKHQQFVADPQGMRAAKPFGGRRGSSSSQNENLGQGFSLRLYRKVVQCALLLGGETAVDNQFAAGHE